MPENLFDVLVNTPRGIVQDTPMNEWPLSLLDEFAYDLVPQGTNLSVITNSMVSVEKINNELKFNFQEGTVAISGFFRGYNNLGFTLRNNIGETKKQEHLVIRLDDSKNNITFIPINEISSVDVIVDDIEISKDTEVLIKKIDKVLSQETLDLNELYAIFKLIDINSLSANQYISYLNSKLQLSTKLMGLLVDGYFVLDGSKHGILHPKEPELVSLDQGRSFSLTGITYTDGSSENILCVNVLTPAGEYARVKPQNILEEFKL